MTADEILTDCLAELEGSVLVNSWGEQGLFYNPAGKLKRGIYILTVKEKDGANDKSSALDRKGVYRLNIGVRPETFRKRFGFLPKRPEKGGVVAMDYDFSALDQIMPHPVYGWMGWISVCNPSEKTYAACKPLIQEAYVYAREKYAKRK